MSRHTQRLVPGGASLSRKGVLMSIEGLAFTSNSHGWSFESNKTSTPRIWKHFGS